MGETKLIGVLGGTSWPSTILPYKLLNEGVQRRLGGHHSARILLYSIDYHPIKDRYGRQWEQIPQLLKLEIERLLSRGPDCWMLANNTLHKAYDDIASELSFTQPFFHAVTLTREHISASGFRRVLLLGTKFTMEDGFFARPIEATGVEVVLPDPAEREAVQCAQSRLAKGETSPVFRGFFGKLIDRYRRAGCEAVVTACTELPLVITQDLTPIEVIDPLVLQCRACLDFAVGAGS